MCGQFAVLGSINAIKKYYEFLQASNTALDDEFFFQYQGSTFYSLPKEFVKPMDYMPILINHQQSIKILTARWGLVPFWAKDDSFSTKTINARLESIHEKPSFKYAYQQRRCLIPSTGFYERDKSKKLLYFDLEVNQTLHKASSFKSLAGIYEIWGKNKLTTFSIITQPANQKMKYFHDRMPLILEQEAATQWLYGKNV